VSPAEERAVRQGLPIVLAIPFELLRVACGHPMIFGTADGGEACVRLFTADEFMAEQHASADRHGTQRVSRERAEELTRPLPDGAP
jgi:hypothetical protein